jgi:P27 family predicted phage terminase small subunit
MRGRKPKPTSRQISEGDPRKKGKNKLAEKLAAEPTTTHGLPACPRHLKGRARSAWGFWATELADMNLDRRPDAMMLEGACVGYERAVQADLILMADGLVCKHITVDRETGQPLEKLKSHPAVAISRAAWGQVRAFCSEFGLSPVSRTRLAIDRKEKVEDLAAILSRPRPERPTAVQ